VHDTTRHGTAAAAAQQKKTWARHGTARHDTTRHDHATRSRGTRHCGRARAREKTEIPSSPVVVQAAAATAAAAAAATGLGRAPRRACACVRARDPLLITRINSDARFPLPLLIARAFLLARDTTVPTYHRTHTTTQGPIRATRVESI
jgi:hypothetical protein